MDELNELLATRRDLQVNIEQLQNALLKTEMEILALWAPVGSTWRKISVPSMRGRVTSHENNYLRIKHNRSTWVAKVTIDELLLNWVPWREQ